MIANLASGLAQPQVAYGTVTLNDAVTFALVLTLAAVMV
jgi:hypothetical protein